MKANTGRRYRLYPALTQAERLANWGHTSRAVWNVALAQRQFAWTQRSVTLRAVGQNRQLTEARAELPWLAHLPAQSAQQVLRNLDAAYDNWRNPQHPAGSPKFKKRGTHLSVAFPGQSVAVRALKSQVGAGSVPEDRLDPISPVPPLGGEIRNATVSRDALGWHVSFGVAAHERPAVANGLPGCGWTSESPARRLFPMSRLHVACHRLFHRGAATPAKPGAPQGPPAALGEAAQCWPVLETAAPHCHRDCQAPGAAGTPPSGFHSISSRPALPNATVGSGSRT